MKKKSIAFLLNLICFGVLFVVFRYGVGSILPLPYLPLLIGSAVLASFLAPKFMVQNQNESEVSVVKIPFVKSVKKL